jgi:hypothetical protein
MAALFRLAGPWFFFDGRIPGVMNAIVGGAIGFGLGWLVGRFCCGLRGVMLAALPGLLVMAAITSHFGLAFPALAPGLDKGFGGLMLWLYGFMLIGGLVSVERGNQACAL